MEVIKKSVEQNNKDFLLANFRPRFLISQNVRFCSMKKDHDRKFAKTKCLHYFMEAYLLCGGNKTQSAKELQKHGILWNITT